MASCLLASGTAGPVHTSGDQSAPDKPLDHLSRVRSVAGTITQRVRKALSADGFSPVRVLVVDDHPDAAESLAAVLELMGCPVQIALNGYNALAIAEEFKPQVCLLDLMMPGMDGLELAARLRVIAAGRPLLLVAATALGDEETRALTARVGFWAHLVKPVDAPTLIDTIAAWGESKPYGHR
jgi:two-component system, OmpR family, response regulator